MNLATLVLFFQLVLSGADVSGMSLSGGGAVPLDATDCAKEVQADWDALGWQVDPYEVSASNTQVAAACAGDSALWPVD